MTGKCDMKRIFWNLDERRAAGNVPEDIYGGFVEHLGRNVYGGVWEPGSPAADGEGFRKDVVRLVRELGMPVTRYPGGCFTDLYRWEDGVGPERRAKLDPAWHQLEPNTFGLHEFMRWAEKAGTRPLITINTANRSVLDTQALYEYCNFPRGTFQSDRRRANGAEKPFGIKDWCLGNELYGSWEIGQMDAAEYGRTVREHAKLLKQLDPDCRLIACGQPDDGNWNRTVLDLAGDYIDLLSLHFLFRRGTSDEGDYLRRVDAFEAQIVETGKILREFEQKRKRRVGISVDEWIIWNLERGMVPEEEWTCGMHLLEQDYTILEALIAGSLLSCFQRHPQSVKLACIAQSVNVIAPIRTEKDGTSWKQSIFYPFALTSKYGRGLSLEPEECGNESGDLYGSAVLDGAGGGLTLFLTNRGAEAIRFSAQMENAGTPAECVTMHHADHSVANGKDAEIIAPRDLETEFDGKTVHAVLPPFSWNMIRLKMK